MKKARTKVARTASKRVRVQDVQVAEFEGRDLGGDIRRSKSARVIRRSATRPTSIALDEELIEKLREKGAKRGLGYQTMLKLIVHEHVEEY